MTRPDGRKPAQLRHVEILTDVQKDPAGSVQISTGNTKVLCAATIAPAVPAWLEGKDSGWITAEYAMLPGAVPGRARRTGGGRAREIQRLIGRSLRAAVDLNRLSGYCITVDCDVIQADGGTRTASITGGFVALCLALDSMIREGKLDRSPLLTSVAAVSCAIVDGRCVLDPNYDEDHRADVDANFVFTKDGQIVEIQSTAEGAAFSTASLQQLIDLAQQGTQELIGCQQAAMESQTG